MCGIAGIYIRKPQNLGHVDLSAASKELLWSIDSRGGDACGYLAITMEGQMQEQKAACAALEFEKEMRDMPDNLRTLLMHTRFATQGNKAFPENNHPVRSGSIRVVHNGVIVNDDEFFTDGITRLGRVDSEAIAAAISKHGWENAKEALEQLDGSFAIAAVSEDHPDQLLLAKGDSSPLVVAIRPSFIMWASTQAAIQYTWKAAVGTAPNSKHLEFLRAGDIIRITPDSVTRDKFEVKRRTYTTYYTSRNARVGWDDEDWSLDNQFGRSTYTYWLNGQKIEYDRRTGTERVVEEEADKDLYNRTVNPATNPLRAWVATTLSGGRKQLGTGDSPYCAQCGDKTFDNLQDLDGVWYCNECLDWLTDLSVRDAMPGESYDVYDQEDADDTPIHRRPLNEGGMTLVTCNPNDYVRCPDCIEYFAAADMVEDKGELICLDCNRVQNALYDLGGEG